MHSKKYRQNKKKKPWYIRKHFGNSLDWEGSTLTLLCLFCNAILWKKAPGRNWIPRDRKNFIIAMVFNKRNSCIPEAVSLRKQEATWKRKLANNHHEQMIHLKKQKLCTSEVLALSPELDLKINSSGKCSKAVKRSQWGTSPELAPWLSPLGVLQEKKL